jgi:3-deoxy-D-manno-octulosonic-acid transferase
MIQGVAETGTPLVLLNGRMSEASFLRWKRVPFLIRPLLGEFALCLGQDEEQTQRLAALGAPRAMSVGNLKYAAQPLPADAATLATLQAGIDGRPVWLASSTHAGEEAVAGRVHRALAAAHPGLLTMIAPRHPDRGGEVAGELRALGLTVARRSAGDQPGRADVYLADTLGELGLFYRLAPVVFMGKTLLHEGGHNPLEPAQLDCALVSGPHMQNFAAVQDKLRAARAVVEVADEAALIKAVDALLGDPVRRAGLAESGRQVAAAEAGVLDAVLRELKPWLDKAGHPARNGNGANGHHAPFRARS